MSGYDAAAQRRYNQSPKGKARTARFFAGEAEPRKPASQMWIDAGGDTNLYNRLRHAAKPELAAENHRRSKAKKREWADSLKLEVGCVDCGYNKDPVALDFDHLPERGAKKFGVGWGVATGRSWDSILEEIAKCEVVCANCHRIRTRNRRQFGPRKHHGI